jgi:hypothetical protein
MFFILSNESISSNKTPISVTTLLPEYLYHSYEGFSYGNCYYDKIGIVIKQKKQKTVLYDYETKTKSLLRQFYTYDSILTITLSKKFNGDVGISIYSDSVFKLKTEYKNVKYSIKYKIEECYNVEWEGSDNDKLFVIESIDKINDEGSSMVSSKTNRKSEVSQDSILTKKIKEFFPIPFIDFDKLSIITKDSLTKHILSTPKYNYDESRDEYLGYGGIFLGTDYIYHLSDGMKELYSDNIYTYMVKRNSEGELVPTKHMYGDKNGYHGWRLYHCQIFGNEQVCSIDFKVSSRKKIISDKYFPPNSSTKYYENRVVYKIVNNKLSSISLYFEKFTNPSNGTTKSPLVDSNNDSIILDFFKELDNLFGKSTVIKTRFPYDIIREWKYKGNRITCKYYDWKGRRQLESISFTDYDYTVENYERMKSKNVSVNMIFPIEYLNIIK